jgi:hypothetical protein
LPGSWQPQPGAEAWILALVHRALAALPAAARLATQLHDLTGTRILDWIDTLSVTNAEDEAELRAAGFVEVDQNPAPFERVWEHPGGQFPRIVQAPGEPLQLWLACEDIVDFCARHADDADRAADPLADRADRADRADLIEGAPLSLLRRARVAASPAAELWVVERCGGTGYAPAAADASRTLAAARVLERFRLRRRRAGSDPAAFAHARALIDEAIAAVGVDQACALFFRAEREVWQRRNHAAQVQRARQDRLGLGWANADHHTYRSSRARFAELIAVLERLGFQLRERFYAGREAGWGAQVLFQPRAGVVVFADVDLSPDEVLADFAHEPLPDRDTLGTVGLWCALHGEAFLQAGLHHLACRSDFSALRDQLDRASGIAQMPPFTAFPHLEQAFTTGERWPVDPARIDVLERGGLISADQAGAFRAEGAIGSHLESIERNAGFQGFNQTGISEIIAATDPRAQRPA